MPSYALALLGLCGLFAVAAVRVLDGGAQDGRALDGAAVSEAPAVPMAEAAPAPAPAVPAPVPTPAPSLKSAEPEPVALDGEMLLPPPPEAVPEPLRFH